MAENKDLFNKSALIFKILYSETKTGGGPIYSELCQWEHGTEIFIGSNSGRWLQHIYQRLTEHRDSAAIGQFCQSQRKSVSEKVSKKAEIEDVLKQLFFGLLNISYFFVNLLLCLTPHCTVQYGKYISCVLLARHSVSYS